MLNIGFIFPSSDYLHDPFRGDPHTHFQILTVLESYFGNKVNLSLIDLRGIKKEFAIYHICECDVYLYSLYTLDYNEQLSIVNNLRKRYPKAKHIAGGLHAILFLKECSKIFDSLVIGEGEECIVQAITDVMNSNPKNVYKQEHPVDINLYPHPLRKYLPASAVARKGLIALKSKKGYDELLSTTVIFSRGCCLYRCAFCHIPQQKKYSPGIRYRTPKLIEAEIEYLKRDYNIEGISLIDDISIPLNPEEAILYLETIGRTGIIWKGQCRAGGITSEIAKLARASGCMAMGMGLESVSQRALDIINKKVTAQQAKETIRILKENDIEARIYLIIGLPGEPEDIVEQTWRFIKESEPDIVFLCLFTVRPGTEVFNNPKKFGIKRIFTEWDKAMHMFRRYDKNEVPALTFEYEKETPWGKGFSSEKIINNYTELQDRLREHGLCL